MRPSNTKVLRVSSCRGFFGLFVMASWMIVPTNNNPVRPNEDAIRNDHGCSMIMFRIHTITLPFYSQVSRIAPCYLLILWYSIKDKM